MDAKRHFLSITAGLSVAVASFASISAQTASAQTLPYYDVPAPLAAAIRADVEALGHDYAGDCKFDASYMAPFKWCSMVLEINHDGAKVAYGPWASEGTLVTFERHGVYGWKNPVTGITSPERVPLLAARPGTSPESWVITGINFTPGKTVYFFDGSGCGGDERCPGDHLLGEVSTPADGGFEVTLQLPIGFEGLPGQTHRLIQANDGSFIRVALHNDGTPVPPTPLPGSDQPTPIPANPTEVPTEAPTAEPTQAPVGETPVVSPTPDDSDEPNDGANGGGDSMPVAAIAGSVVAAGALATIGLVAWNARRPRLE